MNASEMTVGYFNNWLELFIRQIHCAHPVCRQLGSLHSFQYLT